MTAEDRAARLTAFALNDPSLTAADRAEVEANLATDPAARREVEETKTLAGLLSAGLAAELAAQPAEAPVAVPSSAKPAWARRPWVGYAVAASVLLLVVSGGGYLLTKTQNAERFAVINSSVKPTGDRGDRSIVNEVASLHDADAIPYGTRGKAAPDKQQAPAAEDAPPGVVTAAKPLAPGKGDQLRNSTGIVREIGRASPGSSAPDGRTASSGPAVGSPGPAGPARPGMPAGGAGFGGGGFSGGGGFTGGGGGFGGQPGRPNDYVTPPGFEAPSPNDRYQRLVENQFTPVEGQAALSTFGVDVDTASYAIVRKHLTVGQLPPANAVRLEELVNYFPYADKAPDGDNPFAATVELAECPWAPKHRLARIGLKAKPIANDKRPPSNLVFLIDVSGSMFAPNRLPLVKQSLRLLVNELGENDHVAMVVYAGTTGLVLDSTSAAKKDVILAALDRLEAGGSTNGAGGIQQAYAVAVANFKKGGTNRVILCTDGDWNVGTTGTDELVKMIEEKKKTGVFLSVFGFGMGNLRDEMMVQLAGKGNGNYAYIDTLKEAHKAMVEQMGGTLVTVAKDVKIQVEFNPAKVSAYRLLGYEKRILAAQDFHDDTKDAGEMGAGHVVTALYELVPAGGAVPGGAKIDDLRYQQGDAKPRKSDESFVVKMRHKKPDGDVSTLRELPVTDPGKGYAEASEDFRFAAAVASFAMLLRDSAFKGESSFALVQELAAAATKFDPSGYRAEFVELVKRAKAISGKP